jgi:TPR repeat protein
MKTFEQFSNLIPLSGVGSLVIEVGKYIFSKAPPAYSDKQLKQMHSIRSAFRDGINAGRKEVAILQESKSEIHYPAEFKFSNDAHNKPDVIPSGDFSVNGVTYGTNLLTHIAKSINGRIASYQQERNDRLVDHGQPWDPTNQTCNVLRKFFSAITNMDLGNQYVVAEALGYLNFIEMVKERQIFPAGIDIFGWDDHMVQMLTDISAHFFPIRKTLLGALKQIRAREIFKSLEENGVNAFHYGLNILMRVISSEPFPASISSDTIAQYQWIGDKALRKFAKSLLYSPLYQRIYGLAKKTLTDFSVKDETRIYQCDSETKTWSACKISPLPFDNKFVYSGFHLPKTLTVDERKDLEKVKNHSLILKNSTSMLDNHEKFGGLLELLHEVNEIVQFVYQLAGTGGDIAIYGPLGLYLDKLIAIEEILVKELTSALENLIELAKLKKKELERKDGAANSQKIDWVMNLALITQSFKNEFLNTLGSIKEDCGRLKIARSEWVNNSEAEIKKALMLSSLFIAKVNETEVFLSDIGYIQTKISQPTRIRQREEVLDRLKSMMYNAFPGSVTSSQPLPDSKLTHEIVDSKDSHTELTHPAIPILSEKPDKELHSASEVLHKSLQSLVISPGGDYREKRKQASNALAIFMADLLKITPGAASERINMAKEMTKSREDKGALSYALIYDKNTGVPKLPMLIDDKSVEQFRHVIAFVRSSNDHEVALNNIRKHIVGVQDSKQIAKISYEFIFTFSIVSGLYHLGRKDQETWFSWKPVRLTGFHKAIDQELLFEKIFLTGNHLIAIIHLARVIFQVKTKEIEHKYIKKGEDAYTRLMLAYRCELGLHTKVDNVQAKNYYQKLAEEENPIAMFRWAQYHLDDKEKSADLFKKALPLLQKTAEQGDYFANEILGRYYQEGRIVSQDSKMAMTYYKKAITNSDCVDAYYHLGECYHEIKQYSDAIKYFQFAAEQGHHLAQYIYGNYFHKGTGGVGKNIEEAIKWYTRAAENGGAYGQYHLGRCYESGNGKEKNKEQALFWYKQAADQGYPQAQKKVQEFQSTIKSTKDVILFPAVTAGSSSATTSSTTIASVTLSK